MRDVLAFIILNGVFAGVGGIGLARLGYLTPGRVRPQAALAAVGPAALIGSALVILTAIVCLVGGVPVTLLTILIIAAGWSVVLWLYPLARRQRAGAQTAADGERVRDHDPIAAVGVRVVLAALGAYAVLGAWALARVPTRGDDARIWSLRGLTLFYYDFLKPEIFLNPLQSGGHAVYPLFQPLLEATLSRAAGHPALRLIHSELWLVFVFAVWTAGYMLWHAFQLRPPWGRWQLLAFAPLAMLALTPFAIGNIVIGDADTTGSVLLASGVLSLGLWVDTADRRALAVGTLLLAAAASTKDEDLTAAVSALLGVVAVLVVAKVRRSGWRKGWRRLRPMLVAAGAFVIGVAPWRLWLSAHHLTDSVQPPLPRALARATSSGAALSLSGRPTPSSTRSSSTGIGWPLSSS